MSVWQELLLTSSLLLANAFFVGAEFAVISARRSQIEPLADAGRRSARTALHAMEHVSLMLACAQFGITVCSLGLGAVAEPAIAHLLEGPFAQAGLPEDFVHPAALVIALALVTYLHVVVGEMVPKNLALAGPDRVVLVLAPPLVAISRALRPIIGLLNAIANGVLRLLRVEPKDEVRSAYTAEEVQSIVAESAREGLLVDDHGLLTGALEFSDLVAADVMVPLEDLVCVPAHSTPAEVERIVARTGFSRFPVASADGDIVGYLHLKDILYADDERHANPIPDKRVRSLVTVAGGDEVEDALATMQRAGSHLARVIDAQGLTAGVIFLEDVLETLVGEVRDATRRTPAAGPGRAAEGAGRAAEGAGRAAEGAGRAAEGAALGGAASGGPAGGGPAGRATGARTGPAAGPAAGPATGTAARPATGTAAGPATGTAGPREASDGVAGPAPSGASGGR